MTLEEALVVVWGHDPGNREALLELVGEDYLTRLEGLGLIEARVRYEPTREGAELARKLFDEQHPAGA